MSQARVADTYRRSAILTASPQKVVKLLYDGAIRSLERGRIALADPTTARSAAAGESLGRALSIVGELRTSLDHEQGGQVAANLESLYEFTIHGITQANASRSAEHVEPPLRVLRTLKEAWDGIIPD